MPQADIKPQNILLHDADDMTIGGTTRITLIDLGSCLTREQLQRTTNRITYVQSRWYRAPEVVLWAPVTYSADVWSVGCVIAELALGTPCVLPCLEPLAVHGLRGTGCANAVAWSLLWWQAIAG